MISVLRDPILHEKEIQKGEMRKAVHVCSATNRALADAVMPDAGCYSILGPDQDIYFSDAADVPRAA
jgi:hypothetical protein